MDEIVMRLENVRKLLGKAKESSRATVTVEIDHEREEIIATLNRAAASFKLTGLPAPSSFPGEAVYTE